MGTITREGWGRVCGGQQVAGENLYRIGRGGNSGLWGEYRPTGLGAVCHRCMTA
jgi:hypothetical protein